MRRPVSLARASDRQQHRRQNRDDGDDHQEFNEGETKPLFPGDKRLALRTVVFTRLH